MPRALALIPVSLAWIGCTSAAPTPVAEAPDSIEYAEQDAEYGGIELDLDSLAQRADDPLRGELLPCRDGDASACRRAGIRMVLGVTTRAAPEAGRAVLAHACGLGDPDACAWPGGVPGRATFEVLRPLVTPVPELPAGDLERPISRRYTRTVVVRYCIDPAGFSSEARVERSSGDPSADEVARASVLRWQFLPRNSEFAICPRAIVRVPGAPPPRVHTEEEVAGWSEEARTQAAKTLYIEGVQRMENYEFGAAADRFVEAYEPVPHLPLMLCNAGIAASQAGDCGRGVAYIDECVARAEDPPRGLSEDLRGLRADLERRCPGVRSSE